MVSNILFQWQQQKEYVIFKPIRNNGNFQALVASTHRGCKAISKSGISYWNIFELLKVWRRSNFYCNQQWYDPCASYCIIFVWWSSLITVSTASPKCKESIRIEGIYWKNGQFLSSKIRSSKIVINFLKRLQQHSTPHLDLLVSRVWVSQLLYCIIETTILIDQTLHKWTKHLFEIQIQNRRCHGNEHGF